MADILTDNGKRKLSAIPVYFLHCGPVTCCYKCHHLHTLLRPEIPRDAPEVLAEPLLVKLRQAGG